MLRRIHVLVAAIVLIPVATSTSGQAQAPKKVLVLTHAALTKHASIAVAEKALPELARIGGFEVTIHSDGRNAVGAPSREEVARMDFSFLTPSYLAQFDGLLMFTNGNLPITLDQKRSLVDFVRNGKGIVGVHCATVSM